MVELLLRVQSDRNLEVLDDLYHLGLVHEAVLGKLSLFYNIEESLLVVQVHNFLTEILEDTLGKADLDIAVLVQVVLVEDVIDVSIDSLVVAGCWSTVWQLCNGSCRFLARNVVFLAALEVDFKKRIVISGTAILRLRSIIVVSVMKVRFGRLLCELLLLVLQEDRIRDWSFHSTLEWWEVLLLLGV